MLEMLEKCAESSSRRRILPPGAKYAWIVLEGPLGSQDILAVCESFIDALRIVEAAECCVDHEYYHEELTPEDEESYFFYWVGSINREENIRRVRERKDDAGLSADVPYPAGTLELRPVKFYERRWS